jgi:hypothetical protein
MVVQDRRVSVDKSTRGVLCAEAGGPRWPFVKKGACLPPYGNVMPVWRMTCPSPMLEKLVGKVFFTW